MSEQMVPASKNGPRNVLFAIKVAYWIALLVISALILVSYSKFNDMMADYERDRVLLETGSGQLILSQRIVTLARWADSEPDTARKTAILNELRSTTFEFERGQLQLSSGSQIYAGLAGKTGEPSSRSFRELDSRAAELASRAKEIVGTGTGGSAAASQISSSAIASAQDIFDTYRQMIGELRRAVWQRIRISRDDQRFLFLGTLVFTGFFAVLVFGPMAAMLARKTRELMEVNDKLAYSAAHDELTGLHNRAFLADHFETVISGARRRSERVAIMQIDLDMFKEINDTLGHAAGDFVLVKTADRLRDACRSSDLCIRMGGDEFLVVLNGIGDTNDINRVAQRIVKTINQPINYDGVTVAVGGSAGIAVYPVDGNETGDLLVHADLALYNAKHEGGGSFRFFSEELRHELENRKRLEEDIRLAIGERAFIPYFQPQLSLSDRKITGVEALVRWQHPQRGVVSPGEFLKVAEQTGQMVDIGRIIMEEAIKKAAQWHRDGVDFGRLSLNVSNCELREPDFADFIFATLKSYRLPASKLALEIVESVILDDDQSGVGKTLRGIRRKGVQIELDDFGTGYASLTHVNSQEIDRLKIDRRFIADIDTNENHSKIVKAITELARGLGLSIVAEGAETERELSLLASIGCDQVQGFSIAFPMPAAEATEWLEKHGAGKRIVPLRRAVAG